MAAVVNARDVLLQGAAARLVAVTLGTLQTFSGTVSGNVTGAVNSVAAATLTAQASAGYSIQQKLEVAGTTTLKGVIEPSDTGAFKVGTITWDASTGALTGGSGIAITEYGIIGAKAGVAQFVIDTSGNATFSGTLSAASGSFAGVIKADSLDLYNASNNLTGRLSLVYGSGGVELSSLTNVGGGSYVKLNTAYGPYAKVSATDSNTATARVGNDTYAVFIGSSSAGQAIYGTDSLVVGVFNKPTSIVGSGTLTYKQGTGAAVNVSLEGHTHTGTYVAGNYTAGNSSGNVPVSNGNLNANLIAAKLGDTSDGAHTYNFSGGTNTGSATATFSGTNKPGSNSTNTWVKLTIDSTTLYIPAWT